MSHDHVLFACEFLTMIPVISLTDNFDTRKRRTVNAIGFVTNGTSQVVVLFRAGSFEQPVFSVDCQVNAIAGRDRIGRITIVLQAHEILLGFGLVLVAVTPLHGSFSALYWIQF